MLTEVESRSTLMQLSRFARTPGSRGARGVSPGRLAPTRRHIMRGRQFDPQRRSTWRLIAIFVTSLIPTIGHAEGSAKAPDWPNLLSEAGRRAAMALPK